METKAQQQEQQEARDKLRELLPPGSTVHTILRHVSRSGMMRVISPVVVTGGEARDLSYWASKATGYKLDDRRQGVRIGGCGMDMGFALAYELAYALYPDGFECIGEKCRSNDHSNGDRDYTPHHHNSGGCALRHSWL